MATFTQPVWDDWNVPQDRRVLRGRWVAYGIDGPPDYEVRHVAAFDTHPEVLARLKAEMHHKMVALLSRWT